MNESEGKAMKKDIFIPREQWEEYDLTKMMSRALRPKKRGEWIYHGFWPLYMAVSFGEEEPSIPKREKISLWPTVYVWDRLVKKDDEEEKGWIKVGAFPRKRIGVLEVKDGDYYKTWSDTTRTQRNRWLKIKNILYEIVEVKRDEFVSVYKTTKVYKKLGKEVAHNLLESIRKRDESGKLSMKYLFVKKRETGEVRAGMVYELSSSSVNTHYSIGFLMDYKEKDPLMTGLFLEWIEKERGNGYRYFNFGNFWKVGDPEKWKGYSKFKMKYGIRLYDMPRSLIKIKW